MEPSSGYRPLPEPFDRSMGAPPVLQDRVLNERLLSQGFVKLPGQVLDASTRTFLRAFFFKNFKGNRAGFHNDFFHTDVDFRRRGTDIMQDTLRRVWPAIFTDLKPFLYTYLTKFAAANSALTAHRDWMYVDELAGHRSYILYVAVDESDQESGMVHVVPRSHLLPGPPCGTATKWPWLSHKALLRQCAQPLPLEPGEAAIWDNSLIHMSFANKSKLDRVALGLWCHRPSQPLAHFGLFDPTTPHVDHYRVDRNFFLEETPQLLMNRRPRGQELVDHVEVISGRTDSDALLAHLNRQHVQDADDAWMIQRTPADGTVLP